MLGVLAPGTSLIPLPCGVPAICSGIGSIPSDVASTAASTFLDVMRSALSDAADWMVGHVIDLVDSTTSVRLTNGWFPGSFASMRDISVLVILPILMAASIGPVLRQDGRRLFRVWGVGLPTAMLAGLLSVQFVQLGLSATDDMCGMISSGGQQAFTRQFGSLMVSSLVGGAPTIVAMVVSGLLIAGTLLVWLELVVRAASIYLAAFFMPLALVAFIWPTTAGIAKRTVEILAALILSKFVIVAGLTLGLAAVNGGTSTDDTVAGAAILLISGFTPFALLRLAPVVEAAAIAHLEGLSRRPVRATSRTATSALGARNHPAVRFMMSRADSSGVSGRSVAPGAGGSGDSSGGSVAGTGRATPRRGSSVVRNQPVTSQGLGQRKPDLPVNGAGDSDG
jgi:hypothetical protein